MAREIELTVTITYGGAKNRIATTEEADPVIRADLTALGIPHPKRSNVSVVFPGTVRFFWIALPNSMIHKNLKDGIRPSFDIEEHRALLYQLSIERINLRESDLPPEPKVPHNFAGSALPDAGLYAVPMGGLRGFPPSESPSGRRPSESFADEIPSSHHVNSTWAPEALASGPQSWHRNQPPIPILNIKTEPLADMPIHSPSYRTRYDVDDEMQVDSPRRSSASGMRVNRNRYAAIPDPTPRAPHNPEARDLQRELWEVRRNLNADIAQERVVLHKLRDLGAEEEVSEAPESDFAMKARIQQLESELQSERAKRRRLEDMVEDIRRECREPFVVPALLDAFVEISKLTNEALEDG
ncbi:hypothetical protein C8R44DRAFT_889140 [Mycena epipterygia]|nr:hypothetical protein C8R44DRAFT_889140 [Mycena epipterygia]